MEDRRKRVRKERREGEQRFSVNSTSFKQINRAKCSHFSKPWKHTLMCVSRGNGTGSMEFPAAMLLHFQLIDFKLSHPLFSFPGNNYCVMK